MLFIIHDIGMEQVKSLNLFKYASTNELQWFMNHSSDDFQLQIPFHCWMYNLPPKKLFQILLWS